MSDEYLFPIDVDYDLKSPCNDCPFRRDAPDHEGVAANIVNYVESIQQNRFSHTCHKTDNRADGPKNWKGKPKHCAGALQFVIRAGCDLQLPLLEAAQRGQFDIKEMTARAIENEKVFGTVLELVEHYLAVANRILAAREADPLVYVVTRDTVDRPVRMKRSEVPPRAAIITCKQCDAPATRIDHHWPIYITENYCDVHPKPSHSVVDDLECIQRAIESNQ